MEGGNKEKILEMIKAIENKNIEMEEYLSNLSILSRNNTLKKITQDIINKNSLLQELIKTETKIISREKGEKFSMEFLIRTYVDKIQEDPYKKIIFLREFLGLFGDQINEKDKEVILKSLKDEQNTEKLKEEMKSLVNIFKLSL